MINETIKPALVSLIVPFSHAWADFGKRYTCAIANDYTGNYFHTEKEESRESGNHLLLGVKQRELVNSIGKKKSRNPWKIFLKFL